MFVIIQSHEYKWVTPLSMVLLIGFAQKVQIKNMERLQKVIWERPRGIPLVTISNHASCMDDPVIPSEFGLIN